MECLPGPQPKSRTLRKGVPVNFASSATSASAVVNRSSMNMKGYVASQKVSFSNHAASPGVWSAFSVVAEFMLVGFFFRFKATVPLNGDAEGNPERYRRFISGFSHPGFCAVKVGSATAGIQPSTGRKGGNCEVSIH